jgi:membrane protein DedA with SNARE-associated domain
MAGSLLGLTLGGIPAAVVAYAVITIASGLDVLFPPIPSETIVISASVLAAHQEGLSIWLIVPLAALGAMAGDNAAYWLGRRVGGWAVPRIFRGDQARRRLAWAQEELGRRGAGLVIVGRFVPGGRTAACVTAGTLRMPWRRFAAADAVAAFAWAGYAVLIGQLGGRMFEHSTWKAVAFSIAVGLALTAAVELGRRAWEAAHRA